MKHANLKRIILIIVYQVRTRDVLERSGFQQHHLGVKYEVGEAKRQAVLSARSWAPQFRHRDCFPRREDNSHPPPQGGCADFGRGNCTQSYTHILYATGPAWE
jgi:hypothetical protein